MNNGAETHYWKIGALLFVVVAALTSLMYLFASGTLPGLPPDKVALPAITYSKLPPEAKVAVNLQAPIDHPLRGEDVKVTLVVTNWSEQAIDLVPVDDKGPLFKTGDCPTLQLAPNQDWPNRVVPKHSASSFTLRLTTAGCPADAQQPIFLLYKAKIGDVKGAEEVDGYISTAPLTLVTKQDYIWNRFVALGASLLRLFLFPFALAVFGLWLNDRINVRDHRLKEEQEIRDRRGEVLNKLIDSYRELVMDHYLPISRRMQTVEAQLPNCLREASFIGPVGVTASGAAALLCAILLLRARLLQFFTKKGGIYFRSKQAEVLFRELINGFFDKAREKLGEQEFLQTVEMLNPEDTLAGALETCKTGGAAPLAAAKVAANQAAYAALETSFVAWLNSDAREFRAYTRLLQIAMEVLTFECDRPFYQTEPVGKSDSTRGKDKEKEPPNSGWYFDEPKIELREEMYAIPKALREAQLGNDRKEQTKGIYPMLRDYLNGIPGKCRKDVPFPPGSSP
jgi:hypothetical protein